MNSNPTFSTGAAERRSLGAGMEEKANRFNEGD
jgi:hypothetical protein